MYHLMDIQIKKYITHKQLVKDSLMLLKKLTNLLGAYLLQYYLQLLYCI